MAKMNTQTLGIICVVGAWVCFSIQDAVVKWLSDEFALHQITLVRSGIGMLITLFVFMPLEGGYRLLHTRRLWLQLTRGMLIVGANLFYFAGLVLLTLGEAAALFFIAPLLITVLSTLVLKEPIGIKRIAAVVTGFIGVLVIVRPTADGVALASILPIMAAFCYASAQILGRRLGNTERASTLAFYIQLVFMVVSLGVGFAVGDGRFHGTGNPSLDFLLVAWQWPQMPHLFLLIFVGLLSGAGAWLISQGYRLCEAGIAAPFEYVALPLSILWGILIWNEWPAILSWLGIGLIMGAGLFTVYRETLLRRRNAK